MKVRLFRSEKLQFPHYAVFNFLFRGESQLAHQKVAVEVWSLFMDEGGVQFPEESLDAHVMPMSE